MLWTKGVLWLCFCVGLVLATESKIPHFDLINLSEGYHGLVSENSTLVEVTPVIRAVGVPVCSFKIVNKHHGETPFEVVLKDTESNEAELRAKKLLNCEKRKYYKFDIVAVSCDNVVSQNATVHITVLDVNEYAPKFTEPSYVVDVDEGSLGKEIIQVEAIDADCSPKYGDICKYEILNTDQPFEIDEDGVIKNTQALSYDENHNHILSVVSYDCGMRKSEPVLVTVKVNRVCHLGWQGIPDEIIYSPKSGRQNLFPGATLRLCDVPCKPEALQARVSLATSHIGKGCDRDTHTVASQRKLCGASGNVVDLLPSPGPGAQWTTPLVADQGRDADTFFSFDGKTGVVVPSSVLAHNITNTFTLSVWFKHAPSPAQDKHTKEHIICNADDHQMNRHHFSLFVRNCRLILLLRREFGEGRLNTFRPAEWRWKLPQVCDDEWHHYAVSMASPSATLYVDGRAFVASKNNPEIIDDWPLHPTHDINTTLTVGACWQGSENHMKHYFQGMMAGLSILVGHQEEADVISCLHQCKENLESPPLELLQPGMEILNNNDLTELTIEGDNQTNLESLIQKIGYINSRQFPTPGRRPLSIYTSLTCASSRRTLKIPVLQTSIVIQPALLPFVHLSDLSQISLSYDSLQNGFHLYPDLTLFVSMDTDEREESPANKTGHVDRCAASVYPPLNPDHESLVLPESLLADLGLTMNIDKDGFRISGTDTLLHYERVLRQVSYVNRKPAFYLTRAFKLSCSEMNGRFVSNEFTKTITVEHPKPADPSTTTHTVSTHEEKLAVRVESEMTQKPVHAQVERHHVDFRPAQTLNDAYLSGFGGTGGSQENVASVAGASHAVTVIVVVCTGFLLLVITLGIIRVRAAQRRTQTEETTADAEMAWDDSALTIIVNPMETLQTLDKETMTIASHCEDDDSSSDGGSDIQRTFDDDDIDDDEDEEEEEMMVGPVTRDLEWDNSTLSI